MLLSVTAVVPDDMPCPSAAKEKARLKLRSNLSLHLKNEITIKLLPEKSWREEETFSTNYLYQALVASLSFEDLSFGLVYDPTLTPRPSGELIKVLPNESRIKATDLSSLRKYKGVLKPGLWWAPNPLSYL